MSPRAELHELQVQTQEQPGGCINTIAGSLTRLMSGRAGPGPTLMAAHPPARLETAPRSSTSATCRLPPALPPCWEPGGSAAAADPSGEAAEAPPGTARAARIRGMHWEALKSSHLWGGKQANRHHDRRN